MKKLDLLKIIKEEIDIALSETTNVLVTNRLGKTTPMPFNTPADKKTVDTLKTDSGITHIETTSGQKIKEAELEEEQLDEMAKSLEMGEKATTDIEPRLAKANFKAVVDKILANVDGKKTMAQIAKDLGVIQQKIQPIVKSLVDVGILKEKEVSKEDRPVTPKTTSPKPPTKPAASTPKTSPVSSDMTDDEGNKVEIDNTVKPVTGNADIEAELKRVISSKKSKLSTAKGVDYDRELAELKQFLTKTEISKYIKKKTVDGVNPYSIDSILKN